MTNLALVRDPRFQEHLNPESHPESPGRLAAINSALKRSQLLPRLKELAPCPVTEEQLLVVHRQSYIEQLKEKADAAQQRQGIVQLDPDTYMSPETYAVAKLAAGAGLVAVDAVTQGKCDSSFVLVRPPGHHALWDRPMGFCLFNNIALAARYAQQQLGYKRVFIVDWDVHHGNGTQEMFYQDPSVCFVSLHQWPNWPGTGWYTEDGSGDGKGFNINIPLPAGSGDRGYLKAFDELISPICHEYRPDLILLSAGYDAHQFDPLAHQQVTTGGYQHLSERLQELAHAVSAPVVGFLEGGYNTRYLAESVVSTLKVLDHGGKLEGEASESSEDRAPDLVDERIRDLRSYFSSYWRSLRSAALSK